MRIKSFKLKVILSYIIVIVTSFVLTAFFLDRNLEEKSLENIKASLVTQAKLIENQILPESLNKEDIEYLDLLAKKLHSKAECRITITNSAGKVLADSEKSRAEALKMENHSYRQEVSSALKGVVGIDIRHSPTLNINMLYAAIPIRDGAKIIGVLRLALPLESVEKTLFAIRKVVVIGLVFAIILAVILGSILASRTIEPINKMIQVSHKFSEGDFSRRIIQKPNDEIGELAATLNKMAEEMERKIKEIGTQNQKLAAIFNSMIEGIIVVDNAQRIVSVNPTIEKIFGVAGPEVKGMLFLEAIRNNDLAAVISDALKKASSVRGETTIIYPVRKVFEVSATPIFDDKTVIGCLAVIHDITELRKLETVRSDFVANVSHELKTPLTSIKGFVETLLEGAIDDRENNRAFLKIIREHTERLDALVNDLLVLSSLESKEMSLDKKSINLKPQIDEIILGFRSQLNKKGITVNVNLPPSLTIKADKNRIGQVFTNLIDNAIKFNKEKGSIKIYNGELGGKLKIIVEDSGVGIPVKDMPRIFERFYRVDKARSREFGGTGLGLSIVKHIIELHNGSVGVDSVEGFGSKFWFTLPD